jgi:hypothetical protein
VGDGVQPDRVRTGPLASGQRTQPGPAGPSGRHLGQRRPGRTTRRATHTHRRTKDLHPRGS